MPGAMGVPGAAGPAWLREQGVPSVDLHATDEGRPLHTRLGFTSGTGMEPRFDRP